MSSPVSSSDSDTLTIEPTSESKDQVTELLLPGGDSSVSQSVGSLLLKRGSADSGQDTRRESMASSSDDADRRTSLISNVDKESDPPSSGHGTKEQSRHTSIDQGDDSGKKVQPLVKGDSSESSDPPSEPKSDVGNPVVSDDSSSGQQVSSGPGAENNSNRSAIQFSDSSSGHPELHASDSDPSRSEGAPRTDSGAIYLVPLTGTPDTGLSQPLSTNPTITSARSMITRDPEGNWPPELPKVTSPVPKAPSIISGNDLLFTLSKVSTYTFGILYLTGLYCDLWFNKLPYKFNSPEMTFTYMVSLVSFTMFCFVDSIKVHWAWVIPSFSFTVGLNILFIYGFQGSRWWFGFSCFHIVSMFIYCVSRCLTREPQDLVWETFQYVMDLRSYEFVSSIEGETSTSNQIAAEEGTARPDSRAYTPRGYARPDSSDSDAQTPVPRIAEVQIHHHHSPSSGTSA